MHRKLSGCGSVEVCPGEDSSSPWGEVVYMKLFWVVTAAASARASKFLVRTPPLLPPVGALNGQMICIDPDKQLQALSGD